MIKKEEEEEQEEEEEHREEDEKEKKMRKKKMKRGVNRQRRLWMNLWLMDGTGGQRIVLRPHPLPLMN